MRRFAPQSSLARSIALSTAAALALAACTDREAPQRTTPPQAAASAPATAAASTISAPMNSSMPASWTARQAPVRLYGSTYYVGAQGLSIALIDTGAGLILVDAGVNEGRDLLAANVAALGFRMRDIKYILITEPHFDHAGGAAALAEATGATIVASPQAAAVLRSGYPSTDDPQHSSLPEMTPTQALREIGDGEELRLGNTVVKALATPGHTAGSMSWSWQSCVGTACRSILFASSLNAVASGDYHYAAHDGMVAALRRSIARVRSAPCDMLISAHPDNSGMNPLLDQLAAQPLSATATTSPMLRPDACATYATLATERLTARLAREGQGG